MNENLTDLYKIPEDILPQDCYLLDLSEQCAAYEIQVRKLIDKLPVKDRCILETYISLRDDLELLSVKHALRFAKIQSRYK